ncbi:MAG: hypothetical protein JO113_05840 [Candidatus Eremiobacteraeota bacterium]|nr:hypothetical protein [Candidatus Eremiobacteraeota bacterium]
MTTITSSQFRGANRSRAFVEHGGDFVQILFHRRRIERRSAIGELDRGRIGCRNRTAVIGLFRGDVMVIYKVVRIGEFEAQNQILEPRLQVG